MRPLGVESIRIKVEPEASLGFKRVEDLYWIAQPRTSLP